MSGKDEQDVLPQLYHKFLTLKMSKQINWVWLCEMIQEANNDNKLNTCKWEDIARILLGAELKQDKTIPK